jgi:hypothetical protein
MATSRQIGKTTIATVIILHYVLFNEFKTVFVLANKAATAQEVLGRVQLAYEYLPHWLKCGVVEWNKMSVEFENGSKVVAAATSSDAIRGKSCLSGETIIHLKKDNEYLDISLKEFSDKFGFENSAGYLIKSINGYSEFDGVIYQGKRNTYRLFLDSELYIDATEDHEFLMNNNCLKRLDKLQIGDEFSTGNKVKAIFNNNIIEDVYDAWNVKDNHMFYINNIITKNCNMLYIDECITGNSIIKIKDNFSEYNIKIGNLFDKHFKENGILNGTDIIPLNDYQILTSEGYKDFKSIKRSITSKTIKLTLSNNEIFEGTADHILIVSGKNIALKDLQINDYISDNLFVVNIEENNTEQYVYDIQDVADNNSYLVKSGNEYINSKNCAFIQNWEEFSASVLPVISSGKSSKLIFTSTPKGLNHFYEYVEGARKGINDFKLIEVKWNDVPGRDEKWKEQTLATLNNDLERFAQEFEVSFLGSSDNLISGAAMKNIKADALQYKPIHTNISYGYRIYEEPVRDKIYAMTCDVSRGKGLDYSTFHVIDITQIPYKQVATFRNNLITPTDFAAFIYNTAKAYNEAYTLIEINDIGGQVADILYFDYGYENLISTESAGTKGKRVSAGYGRNVDRGIRTTITVKALGCSMLKLLIEQRKLTVYDVETINELSSFVKKGKSYEAEPGKHDDLVMALVLFAWLTTDTFFKNINDLDVMHTLRDLSDEQIFDELVPFGIISTYDMPQEEPRVEKIGNELWSVEDYGPDNMGSF